MSPCPSPEERSAPWYAAGEAARTAGGEVVWGTPAARFGGACYDSREVRPDEMFVAIPGQRTDGHLYLDLAAARGASAFLVSRWPVKTPAGEAALIGVDPDRVAVILVRDTVAALGRLAAAHRRRFRLPVIGVTGSVGKTTAKDMLAHVLASDREVLSNEGNLNSDVGLPVVLLRLHQGHQVAVLEMATRGLGQLTYLAEIAAPAVGIVTAVAPVHLETIGTLDAVARAKAELLRALPPGGWSVVNADSPHLAVEIGKGGIGGPVLSFGFGSRAQVRASGGATAFRREKDTVRARLSFEVEVPDAGVREMLGLSEQKLAASLPYPGRHNALNALAAAIGCAAVGVPFAAALQSLATFGPRSAMRLDISVRSGVVLVDDAYNANPLSMIAALEILQGVSGGGRRLAALGDMLELGPLEAESHRDLGRAVASFGLDLLVAFGPAMRLAVEEAVAAGMPPDRIHHTESPAEALEVLLDEARPGDALLIKGSRGMAMERITAGLLGRWR